MESIPLGKVTFAPAKARTHQNGLSSVKERRFRRRFHQRATLKKSYSRSNFPDFKEYAKPSRLLGVAEPKPCTETSSEKSISSFNVGGSSSFYKVQLQTSNIYGSDLDDQNAGVLICLVDDTGSSILQRIPSISKSSSTNLIESSDPVHFQRGASDEFFFEGPPLGRIEALWIGIDSGQWRLQSVSLTVVSNSQPSLSTADEEETVPYSGFHYQFDADDILLGEGTDLSMVEIRPCRISKLSDIDPLTVLVPSTSTIQSPHAEISSQQSMKEYADLKLSLLSYDAVLIIAGTIISNLSADENAAYAFLIGGMCGFSYLLLLQRSVDGLESSNRDGMFSQLGGRGIKGPIVSLGLVVAITLGVAKYGFGDVPAVVSPKEVILGMMGFLVCKVAVLMAAFKPLKSDWFEGE
ncbi:hypothetical protein LINGRAHAP2_LOCUS16800 [Linum grandiflorum]